MTLMIRHKFSFCLACSLMLIVFTTNSCSTALRRDCMLPSSTIDNRIQFSPQQVAIDFDGVSERLNNGQDELLGIAENSFDGAGKS